jgi:hypothetical protein
MGVFIVNDEKSVATWQDVEVGIREGDRVQITSSQPLSGRVVTLGQQLIDDGSAITIPSEVVGAGNLTPKQTP